MQRPGIDYSESFSPVAMAITVRVGVDLVLYFDDDGWVAELVDVEAEFLEERLKKRVFINLPKGIVELGFMDQETYENSCAELTGGMYGCVDAALLYFIRFAEYATDPDGLDLVQSKVDPCVFFKRGEGERPVCIVICYVDDCLILGKPADVKKIKDLLKKEFGTVEDGQLRKLLGIRYKWMRTIEGRPYVVMSMDDKGANIVRAYEKYTGKTPKVYSSPGEPGKVLSKNEGEIIMMTEYRSLCGLTMFYSCKIAPECMYSTGQLARHMTNPGEEHWIAMGRFVGYVYGTYTGKKIIN